ncbi:MAG: biotin--[acetyl-CoA-carboxylase] ligase [Coprococcus sp.]|nr:biotin--[acetyl-CoA-carboxylase] ligase [Coprococcus sp.]
MKKKILEILKSSNDYVSGQELSRLLGVSRTAIWKNIKSLKAEGCEIDAVNNKGYKLVAQPDIVDADTILPLLNTKVLGRELFWYNETDSTNTRAKAAGETDGADGSLFIAELQTAGKGRRGRSWEAEKGTIVAMTYLLRPDIDIACVSRITLVAAVALARALAQIDGIKPQIKWPNDVLINGRKVCGILTEMSSEGTDINYVVVGIGINVYNNSFPPEFADRATSIELENGVGYNRSKLIAAVTNEFEQIYNQFLENQDLTFLQDEYNSLLVNRDRQVYVISGNERTEYTALGLSPDGGLLVRTANGEVQNIISGEVSVRGIYGYV